MRNAKKDKDRMKVCTEGVRDGINPRSDNGERRNGFGWIGWTDVVVVFFFFFALISKGRRVEGSKLKAG